MACCGNRRKPRSHQKAKRKGMTHSHKFSYSVRKKMHTDNMAKNKEILVKAGLWKPKVANT